MRFARPALFLSVPLTVALSIAGPVHAGTVTVSYVQDARFSDAGTSPWEREANLKNLSQYLQGLGTQWLAPDQTLKLEVLDVDLAGEVKPIRSSGALVRIARGRADWPRIIIRYSLQSAGGQVLKSGEETVSDMNYLNHVADYHKNESLHYEKRMLEQWFKARFVSTGD